MVRLPDGMPETFTRLPVNRVGYPVPWFVAFIDGEPDFRVIRADGVECAVLGELCWLCGEQLGAEHSFVIGPMCAVNRTSAEPPAHPACAEWAVRACPFLSTPRMTRREIDLTGVCEAAAEMITRNPGVALVWTTSPGRWRPFADEDGLLFYIGEPTATSWFAEGRRATRQEILTSIHTGLPELLRLAEDHPAAVEQLNMMVQSAMKLVPAA